MGFLFSAIAGALMSVQGVTNTRLSEKIGLYESNMFVQGTAFVLSLLAMWFLGKGDLRQLSQAPWYSYLGGLFGLGITIFVMLGIGNLSPALATMTILIAQMVLSALIEGFGWLGTEAAGFQWRQFLAVGLMLGGIILFQWKKG